MKNTKKGKIKANNAMFTRWQRIARAMTKEHGVEVVEGNTCATNGKTITIPANADHLSAACQEVLEGMLDHEIGHHTEEKRHQDAGRKGALELLRTECKNKKEGMLLNVYEDIRMERVRAESFIGVAENLAACAKHSADVLRKQYNGADLAHGNFWHILGCGIIYKAQGRDLNWMPAAYRPYLDSLATEIADINKAAWAEDALEIARRTIDKMGEVADQLKQEQEQRAEQAKQEQEQGDNDSDSEQGQAGESDEQGDNDNEQGDSGQGASEGDEQEQGDEGNDSAGENGDEDAEGDEDGQSEGADGQEGADDSEVGENANGAAGEGDDSDSEQGEGDEDGEDAEGDTTGTKQGDSGQGGEVDGDGAASGWDGMSDEDLDAANDLADKLNDDAEVEDMADAAREEMKCEADDQKKYGDEYLTSRFVKDTWVEAKDNEMAFKAARGNIASQIRVMKSKLVRLLKSKAQVSVRTGRTEGDLDPNDLWSVETGNKRVFTQTVEGQTVDTAVSILIDLSGSMGSGSNSRAGHARCATIALAETFNALKMPYEVVGFHNVDSTVRIDRTGSGDNMRQDPQEYVVFKEFNDKYRKVRNRLGSISGNGTNSDSPAVLEMAKRLAARPESRKIMFVLSDGQPNAEGVCREIQANHLRKVVKMATDAGIEVIAIAIQTSKPHSFYNEATGASCFEVNKLEELAVKTYQVMKERLTANRKRGK